MSDASVLSAAEAACAAIRRHARAVVDGTDDRVLAGPDLVEAVDAYGVAVAEADWPVEDLDVEGWLGEEDGVEPEVEPELPLDRRVAVFVRADFEVDDIEALRRAALEQMTGCCDGGGAHPEARVRTPFDAMAELFGHHRSVFAEDVPGAYLRRESVATIGGLVPDEDDPWWKPLTELPDGEEP